MTSSAVAAERLGGFEVDDEFQLGRLLNWQIGRFLPLENASGIDANFAVRVADAGAIAHQTAGQRELKAWEDRGQRMTGRQRCELFPAQIEEGAGADQDRSNVLLRKSCEGRFEVAISPGIYENELQAQRGSSHLEVCDHRWGRRSGRVDENAEPGSIGYQLAEQLQSFWRQLAC